MSTKKSRKSRPVSTPVAPKVARARPKQTKSAPSKPAAGARAKKPLSPLEVQLRRALAEMGLARARRVFAAVEASFDD